MTEIMRIEDDKDNHLQIQIQNIFAEMNKNKQEYQDKFQKINADHKEIKNLKKLIIMKSKSLGNEFSIWYSNQLTLLC